MNMADMNNNSHFYDCSRRYNDDEGDDIQRQRISCNMLMMIEPNDDENRVCSDHNQVETYTQRESPLSASKTSNREP